MVGICPADDDGQSLTQDAPPKSDKISAEQAVQLNDLATEVGADKAKYLAYIGVTSFEEINLKQFNVAVSVLEKKRKKLSDKKGTW